MTENYYITNLRLFKEQLSPYMDNLTKFRNKEIHSVKLVNSKVDFPSLQVKVEGKQLFLHSKYNPLQEAERLANQLDSNVEGKEHIIFFGIGLGYHIEQIMKKYPQKKFTMIEPNSEVFVRFLESRPLHQFPLNNLFALYVSSDQISLEQFIAALSLQIKDDAYIYVLPSYERIFREDVIQFYKIYEAALKMTKSSVAATQAFGKRWVINSLMNLPTTLTTQNILEKKMYFEGKPIIIAAAGPSLYEDMEHLRYIKENGLAYIFAVGSANKAFIEHDLIPDAVVTYDPQPHNVDVFKELIQSGRTDIPMIYGTSVGFETIEAYPGPLFHFVNSADPVTNFYLGKNKEGFDVHDSTTVALVALQVAEKLGASPIILAGQNLAFKNERYYATGIKYGDWEGELIKREDGPRIVTTKDVYGNEVKTNEKFLNMKRDIENYIATRPELVVINTTKGGADIKGASFEPIEDVIKSKLTKNAVDKKWYETKEKKISEQTYQKVRKMERAIDQMFALYDACMSALYKLEQLNGTNNIQQINKQMHHFVKLFNQMLKNEFYKSYIAPVLQIEFEHLNRILQTSNKEPDQVKKIDTITSISKRFLKFVQEMFQEMYVHVSEKLHAIIMRNFESLQFYKHNDGVFHYEGNWKRETITFHDFNYGDRVLKFGRTISTMSSEKGAKIKFRFKGTVLQIFAQTHFDWSNNVKVTLNGVEKIANTKDRKFTYTLSSKFRQKVLEIQALPNVLHDVCIELLEDEPFYFQGIAINDDGRVFHVDEVTKVEKLKIGKRIRCHYKSWVNCVGEFSGLGLATGTFIPVESTPKPNGDFYLIMVDEFDGEKKLIADRNIQNHISFHNLNEGLKRKKLENYIYSEIRLLQIPDSKEELDEWLTYLQNESVVNDELIWNHVRNVDKNRGLYSIVSHINGTSFLYCKYYDASKNITGNHINVQNSEKESNRFWGFRPLIKLKGIDEIDI